MTLEDILNTSKLSTDELSKKIAYKNFKDSIIDCLNSQKRSFMSTIEDSVRSLANGNLYNSCCSENKVELSESDKKVLILAIKTNAEKALDKLKDTIKIFEDIKVEKEKVAIDVNLQVQSEPSIEDHPEDPRPSAINYFRY